MSGQASTASTTATRVRGSGFVSHRSLAPLTSRVPPGAIVTRFCVDDSSFCFLNNHLAAGEENAAKRSSDIVDILGARLPAPSASTRRAYSALGDGTGVLDHNFVFFAGELASSCSPWRATDPRRPAITGDLNFRLTLPRKTVIRSVAEGKLQDLLPFDELRIEMHYDPSFRLHNFEEQAISFAPT